MKARHNNYGAALCWKPCPRPCRILCFHVHNAVEYYGRFYWSVDTTLLRSIVVFAPSRPKMLTKTYNKEVCQAS